MLRWLLVFLVLAVVFVVGVVTFVLPKLQPQPPQWRTEILGKGDLVITVTAAGTVNPLRTVAVGAQISGKIQEVLKVSNDAVKEGDVLARIETELLDSEKRSAEVRLAQAKAAYNQLRVERENLEIRRLRNKQTLDQKRISVERSKGTLELATKNLNRYKDLLKVDATTLTEIDIRELEEANSRRDLKLAEIALEQMAIDDKQIVADAKTLDAREEQQSADIQQAQAQLERTLTNLKYATILSPIDGVVLEHLVEPGQTVAASFQTPNMFRVATDLSHVRIDARLDEADIGRIRVGQVVKFDVDAYKNETFEGTVAIMRLAPDSKATSTVVTYSVLVEASNPKVEITPLPSGRISPEVLKILGVTPANHGWKLLPGMTASLRFTVDSKLGILRLPGSALRFIPPPFFAAERKSITNDPDKKKGTRGIVYVPGKEGRLETRNVVVGETDGNFYELLESDLKEGDVVVVGTK